MTRMVQPPADAALWWRAPWALERLLADLIAAEARLLRPGGPWPQHLAPAAVATTTPGEDGLGFDSLELLGLAAAFSEILHLNDGGLADDLLTSPTLAGWLRAAAAALDRSGTAITIRSSGSSGAPRRHTHPSAQLAAEAAYWARQLPGCRRVYTAVACHHIYGLLFTLMLPAELDVPVDDLRGRSPGAVLAMLRPGDVVIGHPLFWEALLRAAPSGWPRDVVGVTSGAACPDATARALTDAGLARLLDVYGSSETGGIGWRERTGDGWTDGRGAHRLLPWWREHGDGLLARDDDAPIMPPDHLDWDHAGRFAIGRRCDGAVMVGGTVVDPARVRDMLCAHPGVADAGVRLMHPGEGNRLKAFVVPRAEVADDLPALRLSLTAYLDTVLSVPERPRAIRFGRALPLTPSGKPADWLAAADSTGSDGASGFS